MQLFRLDRYSAPALLAWTALFWAGNMVVGRAVAGTMSPISLAYWRWVIVIAILAPFCWREVVQRRAMLWRSWRILLLLGVMSTAMYNSLTYWALTYTTATNTTVLNSMIPICVMFGSWVLLRETPSIRPLMGFAISLVGVLFVVARGHPQALMATAPNPGDLIMLVALFLWGFYAVLLRYRPAELSALGYVFVTGLIGLVIATPFFCIDLAFNDRPLTAATSWQAFAAIGYFALFPTLAATVFYNHAVDRIGPVPASLFIHLVPLFGALLAVVFLDERPGWHHLVGMALVFTGIVLARRAAPPRTASGSGSSR
jgi:drug/metabolite transporter (DMT)-like permease